MTEGQHFQNAGNLAFIFKTPPMRAPYGSYSSYGSYGSYVDHVCFYSFLEAIKKLRQFLVGNCEDNSDPARFWTVAFTSRNQVNSMLQERRQMFKYHTIFSMNAKHSRLQIVFEPGFIRLDTSILGNGPMSCRTQG